MIYTKSRRAFVLGAAAFALQATPLLARKKRHTGKGHAPTLKADPIARTLANHHIHGERDETPDIAALLARIDAGGVIETRCGYIAQVGVLAMQRAGIEARLVGAVTAGPLSGVSDGHTLFEAHEHGAWTLYDVTVNRAAPPGVGIVDQCAGPRHWRSLADDTLCASQCDIILDPGFDDRIFNLPVIAGQFHDDTFRDRLEADGYTYVDAETWRALQH